MNRIKLTSHSNKLLETFGLAEELPETVNLTMHETAKQKSITSRAEFPIKFYHSVSINSV